MNKQKYVDEQIALVCSKIEIIDVPQIIIGVYLLYCKNEVVYVGKSKDVLSRIKQHPNKPHDSVGIIRTKTIEDSESLERVLINHFMPPYNTDGLTLLKQDEQTTTLNFLEYLNKAYAAPKN